MPKPTTKVEIPTIKQVEAFIDKYLPPEMGQPFCTLLAGAIKLHSQDVDTGDGNDDDSGAAADDDEGPRRRPAGGKGTGKKAAVAEDDDEGLLDDGDLLADDGNDDGATDDTGDGNDDDSGAAADDDEGPKRKPAGGKGPGKSTAKVVKATFKALDLDKATIKQYKADYLEGYKAKEIKDNILEHTGVKLTGTDLEELAGFGAYIYCAFDTLTEEDFDTLEGRLATHGLEVDFARVKSEKTKAKMAAQAIIEACIENA